MVNPLTGHWTLHYLKFLTRLSYNLWRLTVSLWTTSNGCCPRPFIGFAASTTPFFYCLFSSYVHRVHGLLCLNDSNYMAARQTSTVTNYVPGGRTWQPLIYVTSITWYPISPAILQGSVNDPTPFPPPSKMEGSHHWAYERLLSASLIPLTGAAFVTGGTTYPVLDGLLGIALVVHSHLGVRN